MKKYLVAAVLAVAVAALASVAFGSTKSPARTSSAGSALVSCGTTRTIGVAAPITGPAAFIGQQQLRWAKFYVKSWNAKKANAKKKIKIVQGDTQLGVDTAFAVKVAKSFSSNSKMLGVVGPAGSHEVVASTSSYKGGGVSFVSRSATSTSPPRPPRTRAPGFRSQRPPRPRRRSRTATRTAPAAGSSSASCRTTP